MAQHSFSIVEYQISLSNSLRLRKMIGFSSPALPEQGLPQSMSQKHPPAPEIAGKSSEFVGLGWNTSFLSVY